MLIYTLWFPLIFLAETNMVFAAMTIPGTVFISLNSCGLPE
jgi:hypothetical protein